MKKSTSQILREIKKAREREANKLAKHIELMGAAYCRATDIPPTEVTLVSRTEEDGTRRYWYERFDKRPDLTELHPDIKNMFDIAMELTRASDAKDEAGVADGVTLLTAFVKKIGREAERDDIATVAKMAKEAEAAKKDPAGEDAGRDDIRVHGVE